MKNILENAKFGDRFKTRNGKMAIYERERIFVKGLHWVLVDGEGFLQYYDNGLILVDGEHPKDIVSRWEEPIDEEKLDELAEENTHEKYYYTGDTKGVEDFQLGFKVGYKIAKKE